MVGKPLADVVCVVFGLLEESSDVVVVHPVLDLVACPADGLDQPAFLQEPQLMRDGGLADADGDGQIPDAEGPPDQGVEDLRARRISECLEGPDDEVEDPLLRNCRLGVRHGRRIDRLSFMSLRHEGSLSE